MQNATLLRGAVFILAAVSPVLIHAQFQQPTPDELKMTSDPKAPGAAAVYLNIEEGTDDLKHSMSVYKRIKVLTEKGKELATVEIPYFKSTNRFDITDKITDIKGRTIHPDGTIIPLNVKPEDLMAVKAGQQEESKVTFTLPSVEVGSILEFSYVWQYTSDEIAPPRWEIQQKYFVHEAHYKFAPGAGGWDAHTRLCDKIMVFHDLPAGVNVTMPEGYSRLYKLDLTDVQPIPDEEWMPPLDSLRYRVYFFYSPTDDPVLFWKDEVKFWADDVDKFAKPSKAIDTAVAGVVAPTDSDLDKARKLYDAVQALDNTDFSREKSASERQELKIKVVKHAEDTWVQKSGSGDDLAMLYLTLARAAGLTAYPIRVVDRDRGTFDPGNIDVDQLDSTLVYLVAGDKQMLLDPGEKMCPFGAVSWRHSNAGGIAESAQGGSVAKTPMQDYKENTITRTGDFELDAHGGLTGRVNIVMNGQSALFWRQAALRNDEAEVKKQFDEGLAKIVPEGVEVHVDHFLGLNDPHSNLMAAVNVTGNLGTATGKRLMLPGFFFLARQTQPFVNEEKRQEPVDMQYGDRLTDQLTYHLPQGMGVEGAPQDANVSWPGHSVFVTKTKSDSSQVVVTDSLAKAFTLAKPEEYQDLRGFYQKVAAADQQQIVLTNAPAAAIKGN